MKVYIGTKIIMAEPMTAERFWAATGIPARGAKSDDQSGYRVIYEDGYVSWSPADVFERAYREVTRAEADSVVACVPIQLTDVQQPLPNS